MIRTSLIAFVSSTLFVAAGCGTDDGLETTDITAELADADKADGIAAAAKKIIPAGAEHLYFGTRSAAYVSDDAPYGYRWFTANAGVEFKTGAWEDDGNGGNVEGQTVDFKLQRAVKVHGRWQWKVVAYGEHFNSGAAAVKYTPPRNSGQGLYLVTAVATVHPATLTMSVTCGGTGCATAKQPGESCGGFTRTPNVCDSGLFCDYKPGDLCGAADAPGTCAEKPEICTQQYLPVCGCDGKTYGNACVAHAAGKGILNEGACN